jgi:methionyl-tRNA formyltransferase
MNKNLRIVFFGTPEFAVGVLKELHKSTHEIVAVVTAPDKPAGRGRKINESEVKKYAMDYDIPVLQPQNLKSTDFIKELAAYKADLQVIVAFRMLPKVVWEMPALGTFNLHASLLPQYRGAAPINWAIINQESSTGVTTFFIDEKIDTGAIIANKEILIAPHETAGSLYEKLRNIGATLSLKTVNQIATGNVKTMHQKSSTDLKEAPKLNANNTLINFKQTATQVDALVRGLYPYPVAKATLINKELMTIKIYETEVLIKKHKMTPGSLIIENGNLYVACGSDLIIIKELQLPNKKRMQTKDLLNGFTFHADARFDVG